MPESAAGKRWREKNRAYDCERKRAWRAANPDKARAHNASSPRRRETWRLFARALYATASGRLRRRMQAWRWAGVNTESVPTCCAAERVFVGGKCDICGCWSEPCWMDHDHATGLFRGWLCRACNTLLGQARDQVDILHRAALYLESERVRCGVARPLCNKCVREVV